MGGEGRETPWVGNGALGEEEKKKVGCLGDEDQGPHVVLRKDKVWS